MTHTQLGGGQMLDCYNQAVSDLAVTITTRVDAANMIYIAEDMKLQLPSELTTRQGKRGKTKTCTDGVSNTLTSVQKDNMLCEPHIKSRPHGYYDGGEHYDISPTVKSSAFAENNLLCETHFRIRKLTERECFRLMGCDEQTIDKIQASGVSRSQQYKLAGNSIVVDVLTAIFDKMFVHTEITELKLFY